MVIVNQYLVVVIKSHIKNWITDIRLSRIILAVSEADIKLEVIINYDSMDIRACLTISIIKT